MNADLRARLGWIAVVVLFCGAAILFFVDYVNLRGGVGLKYGTATVGAAAPDVSFLALDGVKARLGAYRGKPLVVNFFATWCTPCKAELPLLQSRFTELRARGLTVLGVDEQEDALDVRAFVRAHGVTYPVVTDGGSAIDTYGGDAIPTSLFIDRNGVLRAVHIGQMTADILDANLKTIM